MFKRTHIHLTVLNSLVFIILISTLGSMLYSYTHARLYKDADKAIIETVKRLNGDKREPEERKFKDKDFRDSGSREQEWFHTAPDPRILMLVWNGQNELIDWSPGANRFIQNEVSIRSKKLNELHDIKVGSFSFRAIAIQAESNIGTVTVQILRNVNSEQELLDRLFIFIVVGCGIGIICAVAAGYFLAGRALVPIQYAWQKQQQFVSDASHELRTPLAVIQSKTDVLFRSPSATIEEKVTDISAISKECRRLSKLVTNLLTLARSDSDQIEVKKEVFQLDDLLREITENYTEIAAYQEKTLILDAPSSVAFMGDKERIHQLVVILLDNAMKYTKEGGRIGLACKQAASSIILSIRDNGIGIAEEDIPRIFDRFYQSDKARTVSEGAGLGLSIAKWIIEKHKGKVKVQSKLGEGTYIEIVFPKNQK
ncbi:MAG: sensor histidine kinase [Ectobacillus sp.]